MLKPIVLNIRNAKGSCRLADGEGLFYEVTSTGVKLWLYRFKIDGKNGTYIISRYPVLSLKEVRIEHQAAKALVKRGINHAESRREIKQENISKR